MRSSAAASVAKAAAAAAPASPLLATAQAASNVVNAAAGAVTGAINGAVAGAGGTPATATTTTQKKVPRIKPDGRGGYDASELQADAIARAHAMTARYGVTGYSKITGRPTPSTQPSGN